MGGNESIYVQIPLETPLGPGPGDMPQPGRRQSHFGLESGAVIPSLVFHEFVP